MRVVLDTNVLLSGLMLPASVPGQIIQHWLANDFKLVLSAAMLDEFAVALHYPKVRSRIHRSEAELNAFLTMLRLLAEEVEITGIQANVPADANDTIVLATLIAAQADWLVTGDKGLLALREDYPILTPAEFLNGFWKT